MGEEKRYKNKAKMILTLSPNMCIFFNNNSTRGIKMKMKESLKPHTVAILDDFNKLPEPKASFANMKKMKERINEKFNGDAGQKWAAVKYLFYNTCNEGEPFSFEQISDEELEGMPFPVRWAAIKGRVPTKTIIRQKTRPVDSKVYEELIEKLGKLASPGDRHYLKTIIPEVRNGKELNRAIIDVKITKLNGRKLGVKDRGYLLERLKTFSRKYMGEEINFRRLAAR